MRQITDILRKFKTEILYIFFGACTTLVNIVCYYVLYQMLSVSNLMSTVFAWFASVAFAFVTNRRFVFESNTVGMKAKVYELITFTSCRLATGALDVVIMVLAVDYMHWNSLLWKIVSNVLVIVINYVASKFWIFRKS